MTALIVLGVLALAAALGWLIGPDTRDSNYSMRSGIAGVRSGIVGARSGTAGAECPRLPTAER